jgi:phosphate transport system substrate-binding protein
MNLNSRFLGISVVFIILFIFSSGCLDENGEPEEVTIELSGSTTVFPIGKAAADEYMKNNDHVSIIISAGGSGVGIKDAASGKSDIGMASRDLKDSEISDHPNLNIIRIGDDGLSIVVHEDNPLTELTLEQVRKIFLGEIANWSELGWENKTIIPVGRDAESGTRGAFDELVLDDGEPSSSMLEKASNGLVFTEVKNSKYTIGYIGLGYIDQGVKLLKIDGVTPTISTVQGGSYPISRPLNFVTNGKPKGEVKKFIDFMISSDGQQIVEEQDFVPIK